MKKPRFKNHSEYYSADGVLSEEILQDWYAHYQPIGSGPVHILRAMCALIEQVANERGIALSHQPKGLK
jgi:hypothetical protein